MKHSSTKRAPAAPAGAHLSKVDREQLGQRAKARRKYLGLTRRAVGAVIDANPGTLLTWERCLPQQPLDAEAAWEKVLAVPRGWLRDLNMAAADGAAAPIMPECVTVAQEIQLICNWLSRAIARRRTFERAELSEPERRGAEMLALRYGLNGKENSTLEAIGQIFGLTRERTRQITATMIQRATGIPIRTPCMDKLAAAVTELAPCRVSILDAELRGLLGEHITLIEADQFAREVLGKALAEITDRPTDMSLAGEKVAVVPGKHDPEVARAVVATAKAMIRSSGAAHIAFVTGAASAAIGRAVASDDALAYCRLDTGFEWLREEDGWFWLGQHTDNRLIPIAFKVLAVADRAVDAEEIHAALVRSRRTYYDPSAKRPYLIEAPIEIIVEVLRRLPALLNRQYNNFAFKHEVDPALALSETELLVRETLLKHGGAAAKHTITRELIQSGRVKHMALQLCLDSSAIVKPLDFGLYGLRGHSLSPDDLRTQGLAVGGRRRRADAVTEGAAGQVAGPPEQEP